MRHVPQFVGFPTWWVEIDTGCLLDSSSTLSEFNRKHSSKFLVHFINEGKTVNHLNQVWLGDDKDLTDKKK